MIVSKKYVYAASSKQQRPSFSSDSPPKLEDFTIVEETLNADLQNGEILIKAEYVSPENYIRGGGGGLEGKPLLNTEATGLNDDDEDSSIPGSQIGRVLNSKHPDYPVDTLVYGYFGWRTLTKVKVDAGDDWKRMYKLPGKYFGQVSPTRTSLPLSYALGAVGVPGITAHYAVEKILKVRENKTLVVSTATSSVGNLVLQIGKLRHCKTLVFTSTDDKVIWLKTLGAGYIFNYNKVNPETVFREYAPEGIDYYFDNIGGNFTYHVINNMKPNGRIALCDAISCYDSEEGIKTVPFDYLKIVDKRIRLQGFSVYDYGQSQWLEAMGQMAEWILDGQIKIEETVLEGFDKLSQAFIDRYEGRVVGMQVVKV